MKLFTIAALALMAAACSDNDSAPQPAPNPPIDGGGSEPTPLTPDPVLDGPPKVP